MPRSWCYEVLLVRTDWENNLYCEMNDLGNGCNWRPSDHEGMTVEGVKWYKIPNDWVGYSDWWVLIATGINFIDGLLWSIDGFDWMGGWTD